MTPKDAEAVSALSAQLGYELAAQQTADQIFELTKSKDHCAFVAVLNGNIVGWVHGFKAIRIETGPFVEIGGLVVDAGHRNRGVGKKLIDRIKQWCFEQKVLALRVRSNTKRERAHRFYLNAGFAEMKEQKVFGLNLCDFGQ